MNNKYLSRRLKAAFLILLIGRFWRPAGALAAVKRAGEIELIVNEPMFPGNFVWYPGVSKSAGFQVKNRGNKTKTIQIEAANKSETKNLAEFLIVKVRQGESFVYGGSSTKRVRDFFDGGRVAIGEAAVGDDGLAFEITILMPAETENRYQGGKVGFDFRVGLAEDAESSVIVSTGIAGGGVLSAAPTETAYLTAGSIAGAREEAVTAAETVPTIASEYGQGKEPTAEGKVAGRSIVVGGREIGGIVLGLLAVAALIFLNIKWRRPPRSGA